MQELFNPKTIALVGASNKKGKLGNTILTNLLFSKKQIFPINLDDKLVLGLKAYSSLKEIPIKNLDLAIIAVPKLYVFDVLKDCAVKKTKYVIIISSGFKEAGDLDSELKLKTFAKKNKIRIIGPNVLGIFDNYSNLDTLFLSRESQKRPIKGNISLISQSGTVGGILINQFEKHNLGLNRFISYGNACDVNECDLIEELNNDVNTKIIACYIEEVIDGKRFVDLLRKQNKPLVILKAGKSKRGSESVQSHTGNLAGDYSVYNGIFNQFNVINANTVNELVNFSSVLSKPKIKNVTIITNGGGYGILLSDYFENYNIPILELNEKQRDKLKKALPLGVGLKNPIDIMGDANTERYLTAINLTKDFSDTYVIILLGQVSTINKEEVLNLKKELEKLNKNIFFISTMEEYTKLLQESFLVYEFPEDLAKTLSKNIKK
jgi:acyl-CoA synthetase (NDP forming)